METQTNGSSAIVKHEPKTAIVVNAYEPRTSAEAYQMAAWFAKSGLLGEIGTPEKAFLIMATGADLNIPATTALRMISIVKGKPVLAADLMKAMCLSKRDVCEHFKLVKSDDKIATYSAKRTGDEAVVMSFTMEDAQRAKLAERGTDKSDNNYAKYPATMLRHRATAQLAREVFPDIVGGLYCPEEADEIRDEARVIEAQTIDQGAVDDLEQRIAAFAKRIEDADSIATLKAIIPDVTADPAAIEIQARLNEQYSAKKKALES